MPLTPHFSPVCLLILDGWGIGPDYYGNALKRANTPNMNLLWHVYPHTELGASGEAVGLPHGEDGNTETGHLNLGAGQIVYQDLPKINMAIADGSFFTNKIFLAAIDYAFKNKSKLHLMGLVGSGGVHSNIEHLYALLTTCRARHFTQSVYLHLFTDGRDSPPTSGITYISQIQQKLTELGVGAMATVTGRYYAMDRDTRWERTQIAYEAVTMANGERTQNILNAVKMSYEQGLTDEFLRPIIQVDTNGQPVGLIDDNDAVIFFNFRVDRPRQLTKAFVMNRFETEGSAVIGYDPYAIKYFKTHLVTPQTSQRPFQRKKIIKNLFFVTITEYEKGLPVQVAFPPIVIPMPFSRVISHNGYRQIKIAETEKERFVTYYFNGLRENVFPGEDWRIMPSKKVATYDLAPQMMSREITEVIISAVRSGEYKAIIANYAAPDMVAHTGNLKATIQACQIVDECIGLVVKHVEAMGGVVVITSDHGNAEELINLTSGEMDTEHSGFPVPFILVNSHFQGQATLLPRGVLADVAPNMLQLLGVSKPETMTGHSFI